nr:RNase T2 protein [Pestalotiopsis microspora]
MTNLSVFHRCLLALGAFAGGAVGQMPGCRKLSTDADWPTLEEWQAGIPGVQAENNSDSLGPLPDYRIRATTYSDVQTAVKFAAENNVRASVITTGHDQLGRNIAGSGLLIDISLMQGARVSPSFEATLEGVPNLCGNESVETITPTPGAQAAVTFNPAANGFKLNTAMDASGLFLVGGTHAGVAAAGGWGQNGGYGPMSAQYGLGADQWLEAKIVTPDGELKVANAVSNPELFWAIRGGGGSTFGVVVEATWKVHAKVPMLSYHWYMNSTLSADVINQETGATQTSEAIEYLLSQLPAVHDMGNISAYFFVQGDNIRCHAIHVGPRANATEANSIWGPILTKMQSFDGMTPFQSKHFMYDGYKNFFNTTYGPAENVGAPTSHGIVPYDSHLLSASHLQDPNITYALRGTAGSMGILMTGPGNSLGDGSDVAANPGWRNATVFLVGWKTNTTNVDGLREFAPGMGTYINEASTDEPNWSSHFWGSNYPRLSALKSELDPNMVFWISPGINADHMQLVDGRPCLVQPTPGSPSMYAPHTERHVDADLANDREFLFGDQELTGFQFPAPGELIGLQP